MNETIEGRSRHSYHPEQPVSDRRRPGRRDYQNPTLIALLRQNRHLETPALDDTRDDAVAVGIATAAVIAVLTFAAIFLLSLFA
jgi:hypothetical protein